MNLSGLSRYQYKRMWEEDFGAAESANAMARMWPEAYSRKARYVMPITEGMANSLIASIWHLLDKDAEEQEIRDIVDQAIKAWTPN